MSNDLTYSTNAYSTFDIEATWTIDAATLNKNRTVKSEVKAVTGMPELIWWLKCYPEDPKMFGYIGVYLCVQGDAECKYLIDNVANRACSGYGKRPQKAFIRMVRRKTLKIGEKMYSFKELHGCTDYTSDGNIKTTLKARFSYAETSFAPKLDSSWGLRLKDSNTADFNIIAENCAIPIHKFLLSVESPVFDRMFEGDFIEKQTSSVTITDFKHKVVQAAVDYCYGQDITVFFQNDDNVIQLLMFADKYDFQTLKPAMEKCLSTKLTKENVSMYASVADATNSIQIQRCCAKLLKESNK